MPDGLSTDYVNLNRACWFIFKIGIGVSGRPSIGQPDIDAIGYGFGADAELSLQELRNYKFLSNISISKSLKPYFIKSSAVDENVLTFNFSIFNFRGIGKFQFRMITWELRILRSISFNVDKKV